MTFHLKLSLSLISTCSALSELSWKKSITLISHVIPLRTSPQSCHMSTVPRWIVSALHLHRHWLVHLKQEQTHCPPFYSWPWSMSPSSWEDTIISCILIKKHIIIKRDIYLPIQKTCRPRHSFNISSSDSSSPTPFQKRTCAKKTATLTANGWLSLRLDPLKRRPTHWWNYSPLSSN